MLDKIEFIGCGHEECLATKETTYTIPDFITLHFIESGHGFFNGLKLSSCQGFVCPKNKLSVYYPDKNAPWTYTWINIGGLGAEKITDMLPLKNNVFSFSLPENATYLKKLRRYKPNAVSDEFEKIATLYSVIANMFSDDLSYVAKAEKMFINGYSSGITVTDVASQLNISRAYLRNVFYAEKQISPQKFLMDLKMHRAEELLAGSWSISEIASSVGYSDPLQFSKIFAKYYGISPLNYRKKKLNSLREP